MSQEGVDGLRGSNKSCLQLPAVNARELPCVRASYREAVTVVCLRQQCMSYLPSLFAFLDEALLRQFLLASLPYGGYHSFAQNRDSRHTPRFVMRDSASTMSLQRNVRPFAFLGSSCAICYHHLYKIHSLASPLLPSHTFVKHGAGRGVCSAMLR